MAGIIGDISSMLGANSADMVKNSTSRKGNTELNMNDFLQLMIVQLTNQTIDDTMDTSEMMNQMLQMQMITAMANMNDISVQSYANSLVNKWVTVGVVNGNTLEERYTEVMATGTYNGQQVIFCRDGNMYYLSQIMAVGELPDEDGNFQYSDMVNGSGCCGCNGGTGGAGSTGGVTDEDPDPDMGIDPEPDPDDPDPDMGIDPDDPDLTDPGDAVQPDGDGTGTPEYDGSQGADAKN